MLPPIGQDLGSVRKKHTLMFGLDCELGESGDVLLLCLPLN